MKVSAPLLSLLLATACAKPDDEAGDDEAGTPSAACEPATWDGWAHVDGVSEPAERGLGSSESMVCQQPTADTTTVTVTATLPEGVELGEDGAVRVLVFEYDPNFADASAYCVNLACESTAGSDLSWQLEVPQDRPDLGYYVVIDVDANGNGSEFDPCVDLFSDGFSQFAPADGAVAVEMALFPGDGC